MVEEGKVVEAVEPMSSAVSSSPEVVPPAEESKQFRHTMDRKSIDSPTLNF